MITTNIHHEVGAALAVTGNEYHSVPAAIKLGVDIHEGSYVVVAQEDHATPRPAQRFAPGAFVPWVGRLLARGHRVFAVYEACGFGFGLCRRLWEMGAHCCLIAPRKLDEARTGVKTDPRDALTLCRQRQQLVRARQKLEAQGRGLLVTHGQPVAMHWWKEQTWGRLKKLLPGWIHGHLEGYRPALPALHAQILALSARLEASAPADLPAGLGKLTAVLALREVCDWGRFANRRQVSSPSAGSGP